MTVLSRRAAGRLVIASIWTPAAGQRPVDGARMPIKVSQFPEALTYCRATRAA
jgi:hypothetical protein